jgi:hypothetical protein
MHPATHLRRLLLREADVVAVEAEVKMRVPRLVVIRDGGGYGSEGSCGRLLGGCLGASPRVGAHRAGAIVALTL